MHCIKVPLYNQYVTVNVIHHGVREATVCTENPDRNIAPHYYAFFYKK